MALRGKKAQFEQEDSKTIEINAQMQGTLTFSDPVNLKINGNFKGTLDAKGTLTIGNASHVDANITGDNIVIGGRVTGDINANKMLVLMPTAVLRGNIVTPKLNIVEGAIFQGSCQMRESMLNLDEVSKYLEIDLEEIKNLANSGKIPGIRKGDSWQFERNQIDNWISTEKIK